MKRNFKILLGVVILMGVIKSARADIPQLINFSGQLFKDNAAVATTTSVEFRLFTASSGGTSVFTETKSVTPDANGIYHVLIGETTSLVGVDFSVELWLELEVDGEVMSPRFQLGASPYSLRASTANAVAWTGITGVPAGFADGVDDTGGAPGPNSVGTTQIIDSTITASDLGSDSVTSAKILDATIVNADIAAGAAIELSKLEANPSTSGTINTSTNPVDWTKLKSVPAGFADGVDDTGGAPGPNSVGTTQIINSTIAIADIDTTSVDTRYVTLGTAQSVTGSKTMSAVNMASATFSGVLAANVSNFTASNGNNNSIAIGNATMVRITGPTASFTIRSIAGGYHGRMVVLINMSDQDMTIANNAGGAPTNRIFTADQTDIIVNRQGAASLVYSTDDSRWIVIGYTP